jgi:hypothetical protein
MDFGHFHLILNIDAIDPQDKHLLPGSIMDNAIKTLYSPGKIDNFHENVAYCSRQNQLRYFDI